MSAGYGYFRIEFYTGDGSADADAAKRAYDWCKENYGWFRGEKGDGSDAPFLLNKNKFVPNEDAYPDGLDIKYGDVPDNTAWLQKPFKAVKAARLVASIHQDYSETSYGSNSYHEGVWERGRSFCFYELPRFNTSMHPAYIEIGPGRGIHISDGPYGFTYRQIRGLFKNAKTGEEILCGEVRHNEDKRNDRGELSGTLRIGEASFPVLVGDDDVSFEDGADEDKIVSAFVSALKKVAGYKEAVQDEWTFEDFGTQRTLFDLYGSNPPIPQYTTLSVNSDGSADIHKGEAVPQMKEDEADNPLVLEAKDFDEAGVAVKCLDKSAASVEIPASVTKIDSGAFSGCTELSSVAFGGTMAQWDAVLGKVNLFNGDVPAKSVKCADGEWQKPVVHVENGVAVKCLDENAMSVTIPDGVTRIGWNAFENCKSLSSVEIPSSVTEIGASAFWGCESLSSVVIPSSVTLIDNCAFSGCTALSSVEIPEGVTICCYAFERCTALASVVIGAGVTAIGWYAFRDCTSLASVVIPDSVTEIGRGAFYGCTELSSVAFGGTMAQWDAVKDKIYLFIGDVPATSVKCADGVWQRPVVLVEDGVAVWCLDKSAASVEIPAGVTEIGEYAFEDCTALASVEIPEGVTGIGKSAFKGCTALKTVVLADGLAKVKSDWFKDLPSDYEIVCTEGSAAFKSVKRSPKLKAHIKAKL